MIKVFCFVLFFSIASKSSILVRNGGDLVQTQNQLVVRDVFEVGNKVRPLVVENITDAELAFFLGRLPDFAHTNLDVDRAHLSRWLIAIDRKSPNLGLILADAIQLHSWFGTESLPLLPDIAPTDGISQNQRRQGALRYGRQVLVDTNFFKLLDDDNKFALFLHEVIYSFVIGQVREENLSVAQMQVMLRLVRSMVGALLYGTPSRSLSANIFGEHYHQILSQDSWRPRLSHLVFTDLNSREFSNLGFEHIQDLYNAINKIKIEQICRQLGKQGGHLSLSQPPPTPFYIREGDRGGNFGLQLYAREKPREITSFYFFETLDEKHCRSSILNFAESLKSR